MTIQYTYYPQQRGFTLLESMIALVILSVGLLGVAGLQSLGLQMNSDALQRTQATILIYNIAEKMRMDPENALEEAGSNSYEGTITAADSGVDCMESSNTAADILVCWQVFLRDQMPTGSIAISAPGDDSYPRLCTESSNALADDELGVEIRSSDNWIERGTATVQESCQTFVFNIRST